MDGGKEDRLLSGQIKNKLSKNVWKIVHMYITGKLLAIMILDV